MDPLPIGWRIMAKHLATGSLLSAADLFEKVYGQRLRDGHESVGTIDIAMLQLRTWFQPFDIEIMAVPDRGYFIPASQLQHAMDILAAEADHRAAIRNAA
jgi:hypothetical protein